jgi:hypothetical protein
MHFDFSTILVTNMVVSFSSKGVNMYYVILNLVACINLFPQPISFDEDLFA